MSELDFSADGVSATYDALGRMVEAGSQEAIYRLSGDKLALLRREHPGDRNRSLLGGRLEIHRQR